MAAVLKGEALSRCYVSGPVTVRALWQASFEINSGEFTVVLGPSGSGKSTLLNLLGGMDRPTSGSLWYGENNLGDFNDNQLSAYRKESVGFIFQFFNLIPSLTARENVKLASDIVSNPMDVDEVLDMVRLSERAGHFPAQLSGGEQQRISIARAIVKNPKLLLCDEPTGALDSANSIAVVKLLLEMRSKLGCPVIAITHNASMAQVADRVLHMKDGMIEKSTANAHPLPVEGMVW